MASLEYKGNKRDGIKDSYADVDNNINKTSINSKTILSSRHSKAYFIAAVVIGETLLGPVSSSCCEDTPNGANFMVGFSDSHKL